MRHVDDAEHVVVDGLLLAGDQRTAVHDEIDLVGALLERLGRLEGLD